jgi:O-antigen/teichoic acid export membrane protein
MASAKLKWFGRGLNSALSAGRSLISPAVNFLVAYIVIQLADQKTWGQFVEVLIFTSLCSMFVSFGIKGHILRQVSLQPHLLGDFVKSGILVRLILLIPCALASFIFFPTSQAVWLTLWLLSLLVYSGLDPIVNFSRSYGKAIVAELVFTGVLLGFLMTQDINQAQLVFAFSVAAILRSVVLFFLFRTNIETGIAKFDLKVLAAGFPFLIMGFSGMLQAKTDLYLVSALLTDNDLAIYQVSINVFLYLQALSGLALIPFAKNIYRLPKKTVWKVSVRFTFFGFAILMISLPVIYWALNHLYGFDLGGTVIIIGGLYVLPSFIFSPMVYKLLGKKKEETVLYITLLGVLVNLILTYSLVVEIGIKGGFIGSMISNWAMLIAYVVVFRTKLKSSENV